MTQAKAIVIELKAINGALSVKASNIARAVFRRLAIAFFRGAMGQVDAVIWGEITVGTAAMLVAAALSVYFYLKPKKKPGLSYQVKVKQVLRTDAVNAGELLIRHHQT